MAEAVTVRLTFDETKLMQNESIVKRGKSICRWWGELLHCFALNFSQQLTKMETSWTGWQISFLKAQRSKTHQVIIAPTSELTIWYENLSDVHPEGLAWNGTQQSKIYEVLNTWPGNQALRVVATEVEFMRVNIGDIHPSLNFIKFSESSQMSWLVRWHECTSLH